MIGSVASGSELVCLDSGGCTLGAPTGATTRVTRERAAVILAAWALRWLARLAATLRTTRALFLFVET